MSDTTWKEEKERIIGLSLEERRKVTCQHDLYRCHISFYLFWQNYFCDQDFVPLDKIPTFAEVLKESKSEEDKVSDNEKEVLLKDLDLSVDLSEKVI